jgi:hypothetical protein
VAYRWDAKKAKTNHRKHGVHLGDAVGVFEDPRAVTVDDPHPHEERFVTLGLDLLGRLLVVWTWRSDDIRIISARPATRHEQGQYEEEG